MPDPNRAPDAPAPAQDASVAIAHDYLLVMRGAERTFAAIAEMYPDAPILTLLYDEQSTGGRFADRSITTSALQRLGIGQSGFRRLLPMYPIAASRMTAPECDVLVSSSSAFAHGIHVRPGTVHACYSHTPFRYAWYEQERAIRETPAPLRGALRMHLRKMRKWDLQASSDVDLYIANSKLTRDRIRRFYGRDAPIVHPPVETQRFSPREPGDHLLLVSELVRHKRVHVALEAARRTHTPIRIVGSGPEHKALSASYPEAEFLGRASDEELVELYGTARAMIVPSREEFGITAVEAQAAGRPVIAADAGGAQETVINGETGILVTLDDVDAFALAVEHLDELDFHSERAVANAERFSVSAFQRRLAAQVQELLLSDAVPRSIR
jgi:glycosyltransferase involved in cell wall biosynthesis